METVFFECFFLLYFKCLYLKFQELDYSFTPTNEGRMKRVEEWSQQSISEFKRFLRDSCCIYFQPSKYDTGCYYGDLIGGISSANMLISLKHAIRNFPNYLITYEYERICVY